MRRLEGQAERGGVVVIGPIARDVTMLVDALPERGGSTRARELCVEAGGKGANPAVAATALGVPVALVGAVGDDEAAVAVLAEIAARGVDVSGVARSGGAPTSHIVHLVQPGGARRYVEAVGATDRLHLDDEQVAVVGASAKVVLLSTALPVAAVQTAARAAAGAAATTLVVDAAGAPDTVRAVLRHCDVLRCDAGEAHALVGHPIADFDSARAAAQALRAMGPETVIVQAGVEGDLVLGQGIELRLPLLPIRVVNPTGGGDAFVGVLAAGLARGDRLQDAARLGSAAAALTVARLAAQSRFTERELDALIRRA